MPIEGYSKDDISIGRLSFGASWYTSFKSSLRDLVIVMAEQRISVIQITILLGFSARSQSSNSELASLCREVVQIETILKEKTDGPHYGSRQPPALRRPPRNS